MKYVSVSDLFMIVTRYDTAYIGLSYVQSIKNDEKISIGCSQLFDSEGNGMELYLRPLKDPQIIQRYLRIITSDNFSYEEALHILGMEIGDKPDDSMIQERNPLTVSSTRRNPVLADLFHAVLIYGVQRQ